MYYGKTLRLIIDGKETTAKQNSQPRDGWARWHIWGHDLTGRACPVEEHSLPADVRQRIGQTFTTGGHTYKIIGEE